eukprot:jgi/Mesvir1/18542/Mv05083-RA.1
MVELKVDTNVKEMMSVRMPGRGMREFEEPVKSMEALVDAIAGQVAPYMLSPCVMMGVGMGGVVAYYLIKELKRRDLPIPMRLFLLGRPTLLPSLQKDAPVDAQAARALVDKWGLQPESDVDKELWLSHVTADLQLLQSSDPALGVTRWPRESLVTLIHLDGAWAGSPESQATLEAWKRLFGPDADCIKCEYLEGVERGHLPFRSDERTRRVVSLIAEGVRRDVATLVEKGARMYEEQDKNKMDYPSDKCLQDMLEEQWVGHPCAALCGHVRHNLSTKSLGLLNKSMGNLSWGRVHAAGDRVPAELVSRVLKESKRNILKEVNAGRLPPEQRPYLALLHHMKLPYGQAFVMDALRQR